MRRSKPRGCDKQARQKNRSKTPREDLGMRRPRPKGGAAQVKSHELCQAWSECKIDERRRGVPTRPHLSEGRCFSAALDIFVVVVVFLGSGGWLFCSVCFWFTFSWAGLGMVVAYFVLPIPRSVSGLVWVIGPLVRGS